MGKTALLLAFCAGMAIAAQASAQASAKPGAKAGVEGGYLGIGIMSLSTDNASDFGYAFRTSGERSASGIKVYGGYLWPSRFGVEFGYYDLGSYDVFTGGAKTDEFSTTAGAVSGVFALPFARQFVFNSKIGVAFTSADYTCIALCSPSRFSSSKTGIAGLFGAGVGWRPAHNFTVRADLEIFASILHKAGVYEAYYPYSAFSVSGQVNF